MISFISEVPIQTTDLSLITLSYIEYI